MASPTPSATIPVPSTMSTTPGPIFRFLESIDWLNVVQIILIVFLVAYFIVSLLVIKQINMMIKTIKTPNDKFIVLLGYAHSLIVLLVLLFTIIVL